MGCILPLKQYHKNGAFPHHVIQIQTLEFRTDAVCFLKNNMFQCHLWLHQRHIRAVKSTPCKMQVKDHDIY